MAAFTLDGKGYYDSYKGAGTKIFAIVTNGNEQDTYINK